MSTMNSFVANRMIERWIYVAKGLTVLLSVVRESVNARSEAVYFCYKVRWTQLRSDFDTNFNHN